MFAVQRDPITLINQAKGLGPKDSDPCTTCLATRGNKPGPLLAILGPLCATYRVLSTVCWAELD